MCDAITWTGRVMTLWRNATLRFACRLKQCLGSAMKPNAVDGAVQIQDDLYVVNVLPCVVMKRMKQKPFLQGREREDVFQARAGKFEVLYVRL